MSAFISASKNTKYAILIIFVLAAVITPTPDIPDMMVVAIPMLALYLLGVGVAFLFGKKRKKEEARSVALLAVARDALSISGRLAYTASPTFFRLSPLTLSSVSDCLCQSG